MEICHFINLMALIVVFAVVIVLPIVAYLVSPSYRLALHRAYRTPCHAPSPLLPLPAQATVVRRSYRISQRTAESQKYAARHNVSQRKTGHK